MTPGRSHQVRGPTAEAGRRDAEDWLDQHGDALYRYARSRVGHRELAEDLVQDTLLAALESRARFQGRSSVRTWLLSILRRKVVDHYRRLGEARAAPVSDAIDGPDPVRPHSFNARGLWKSAPSSWKAPDQAVEDREFWDVLDGCLGRLPRVLAAAFVLRELEGLELPELRKTLSLSEGNLRVRLHRARLLLRECLERRWFAEAPGRSRRLP